MFFKNHVKKSGIKDNVNDVRRTAGGFTRTCNGKYIYICIYVTLLFVKKERP